jgi:PIN domain nuclease of toxin-antitoxin system
MLLLSGAYGVLPEARAAICDAGEAEALFISPCAAWEIGALVAKGRLNLGMRPEAWFASFAARPQLRLAAVTPAILIAASFLPAAANGAVQGDFADAILAATAREYGYTLVTRDPALLDYAKAGHINAIEC